jgi:hypothetical protein
MNNFSIYRKAKASAGDTQGINGEALEKVKKISLSISCADVYDTNNSN